MYFQFIETFTSSLDSYIAGHKHVFKEAICADVLAKEGGNAISTTTFLHDDPSFCTSPVGWYEGAYFRLCNRLLRNSALLILMQNFLLNRGEK